MGTPRNQWGRQDRGRRTGEGGEQKQAGGVDPRLRYRTPDKNQECWQESWPQYTTRYLALRVHATRQTLDEGNTRYIQTFCGWQTLAKSAIDELACGQVGDTHCCPRTPHFRVCIICVVTMAAQAYYGGKKKEAQATATYDCCDHVSVCRRFLRTMSTSTRFNPR